MPAIAALLILAALAIDLSRPPPDQLSAAVALTAIHLYQSHLAVAMGRLGVRCRFEPSCSEYTVAVIARFGLVRGGWLAVRRLLRCGPWTPAGTSDPPPRDGHRPSSNRR